MNQEPASPWKQEIETRLRRTIVRLSPVGGGDFASSFKAQLDDGRTIFVKTHQNPPPGFFTTEAAGLGWLRSTGTVLVPEVIAVSDTPPFLALEWIEPGPANDRTDDEFGRSLAQHHSVPFEVFGRPDQRTTSSQAMDNRVTATWAEFYAERRIVPLTAKAVNLGAIDSTTASKLDVLVSKIDDLVGPVEPPSCLHGDLWAGNRMVDAEGQSWMVDPAAFGGHREFDLALMKLFGGFSQRSFDAYHEQCRLADGWRERIPFHQLATLLVHAIKFGGGYASAVERSVAGYV